MGGCRKLLPLAAKFGPSGMGGCAEQAQRHAGRRAAEKGGSGKGATRARIMRVRALARKMEGEAAAQDGFPSSGNGHGNEAPRCAEGAVCRGRATSHKASKAAWQERRRRAVVMIW